MFHFSSFPSFGYRFRRPLAVLAINFGLLTTIGSAGASEAYVPYSNIQRGPEGVNAVVLDIRNESGGSIRCMASLAHWYSASMGEAAPGKTLQTTLWHDPQSGELSLMNDQQDRMPVEALWCGHPPRAYETRSRVKLNNLSGETPNGITLACVDQPDGRLMCH